MTTCTLIARNDAGQPIHTAIIDMTQDPAAQVEAFLAYVRPLLDPQPPISQEPPTDPEDVDAFALRTAIVAYHLVTAAEKRRRQLDQHRPLTPSVEESPGEFDRPLESDPDQSANGQHDEPQRPPDPEQCPHCGSQMGIHKGDPDPTKYLCLFCGEIYQAEPPAAMDAAIEEDLAAWLEPTPETPEDIQARAALEAAKAADHAAWYADQQQPRPCPVCAGRDIAPGQQMCQQCEIDQMEYMNDPDAWEEDL